MDRIGVLLPTWIGDACMATPMLRTLRATFPDSHLTLIGRPVLIDMLAGAMAPQGGSLFDSTIQFNKKASFAKLRLAMQMRRRRFDCLLLTPNAFWTGVAAKLSLAKRSIGYGRDGRSWLLTDPIPKANAAGRSQIEAYLQIPHWIGCDVHDKRMSLGVTPDEADLARGLWREFGWDEAAPTLVINNNTAMDRRRVWPADRVEATARHAEQKGWQVLLHCGPGERDAANATASRIGSPKVASMGVASDLPIGLTKAVLERAGLVLTSDSGPRHIAVALNRPVISLFGPTDPAATQTFNTPEVLLAPEASDSMQEIALEKVLQAFDVLASQIPVAADGLRRDTPEAQAS